MISTLNVAVIGTGNIGKIVAANLVRSNRSILIADRAIDKSAALAKSLGDLARPMEIADAMKTADIIIMAVWFTGIQDLLKTYATALEGKIIVDPSNPVAPAENGGFMKTIPEKQSAGEIIAGLLPIRARFAKALGSLGASSLANAAFQKPRNVLFYATDDVRINADIEQLIVDDGFEPVRIGGIDQSIRIEVFGDLHEFGAIGKPVQMAEALRKLS